MSEHCICHGKTGVDRIRGRAPLSSVCVKLCSKSVFKHPGKIAEVDGRGLSFMTPDGIERICARRPFSLLLHIGSHGRRQPVVVAHKERSLVHYLCDNECTGKRK